MGPTTVLVLEEVGGADGGVVVAGTGPDSKQSAVCLLSGGGGLSESCRANSREGKVTLR